MAATLTADNGTRTETIDLETITDEGALIAALWELFPLPNMDGDGTLEGDEEHDPDAMPPHVSLSAPEGFAVHCFTDEGEERSGGWDAIAAWAAMDNNRREAFEAYAEDVHSGSDAPSEEDFDEAYQGQYSSGGEFAQETAEQLGEVPDNIPSWIIIDWQASWDRNLRHDYTEARGGHFFSNI